jgi:hypothetical protein
MKFRELAKYSVKKHQDKLRVVKVGSKYSVLHTPQNSRQNFIYFPDAPLLADPGVEDYHLH